MKKDIHILNWSKIIHDKENEAKIINKGILFEDLIEKLLKAVFPEEEWRRTKKSYDGKRDFVYPADEKLPEQKWAECKNYKDNLSINVIAPTLVMGSIENINSIYFFSYSRLNSNALEGLYHYSKQNSKTIKVYDGSILESLICKYRYIKDISEFFPENDLEKAYLDISKNSIRTIVKINDIHGIELSANHQFKLGEKFSVSIIIQNLVHDYTKGYIFVKEPIKNIISIQTKQIPFSLEFSEIKEYSVICEALMPGKETLNIELTVEEKETVNTSRKITIIDDFYLFWSGEDALRKRDACINHLLRREEHPLIITSGFGMGKSSLLDIALHDEEVVKKYKIIKIDLSMSRNSQIKSLFPSLVNIHREKDIVAEQKTDDDKIFSAFLTNYAISAEMIAQNMMKLYNEEQPFLFVIDDLQIIGRAYTSLIYELQQIATAEHKKIYYLLAYDGEISDLQDILEYTDLCNDESKKYTAIELFPFTKNDILAFLYHKFGLEDIDSYFEGFEQRWVTPLNVCRLSNYLQTQNVISNFEGNTYSVIDQFTFADSINKFLINEMSISAICDSIGRRESAEFVLKILYFMGDFNLDIFSQYKHSVYDLASYGIVQETSGTVRLCQQELRHIIKKEFSFSEEDYIDIYCSSIDYAAKIMCLLNLNDYRKEDVEFLNKFFAGNYEIGMCFQRYDICHLIILNQKKLKKYVLTQNALRFVRDNFEQLRMETGHSALYSFMKEIADAALYGNWDTDIESVEIMAFLIKKYFDRALSTYNHSDGKDYFEKYVTVFSKITHISESRRSYWLAHYANRTAIIIDRDSVPLQMEPNDASKMYDLSEKYCQNVSIGRTELEIQIAVDNFNRYYFYQHTLTPAVITNTYNTLQKIRSEYTESSEVLEYHIILLEYLRYKNGENYADTNIFTNYANRVGNQRRDFKSAFYVLKLYMIQIYSLTESHAYKKALELTDEAISFAYKKDMRSHYYKLIYIKAFLLHFQGASIFSPQVQQSLLSAYEQLLKMRRDSVASLNREIFLLVHIVECFAPEIAKEHVEQSRIYGDDVYELVFDVWQYKTKSSSEREKNQLYDMTSYFVFQGYSFPNI